MKRRILQWSSALALAGAVTAAHAAVPAGISGSWINPSQGGHGFSVEVLPDGRAIAFWFVYDPAGHPVHLYLDGEIVEDAIIGTAYYNEGMKFGTFDEAERTQSVWGAVRLTFADCGHGWLEYNANGVAGTGYGSGRMPLARLSRIGTQACDYGIDGSTPSVALAGRAVVAGSTQDIPMRAAIDPDGRIWATPVTPPGPSLPIGSANSQPVLVGDVISRGAAPESPDRGLRWKVLSANAFTSAPPKTPDFVDGALTSGAAATAQAATDPTLLQSLDVSVDGSVRTLSTPAFDPAVLAPYTFDAALRGAGGLDAASVTIDANGAICIVVTGGGPAERGCQWRGQATPAYDFGPFFDFTLRRVGDAPSDVYVGRGWWENGSNAPQSLLRIVLVGANLDRGLGLVAERRSTP